MKISKNFYSFFLVLGAFFLLSGSEMFSQVKVDSTASPEELVNGFLVGEGVNVRNIRYRGAVHALGSFEGLIGVPELDSGIILSTGDIADLGGPNDYAKTSTVNYQTGDPQLRRVISSKTYDAAVLDMELQPKYDSLIISFSFASEEYDEYLNSKFEDGFVILLIGPGMTTGKNIGVVPGTNEAVTIHTVNMGTNRRYLLFNNQFNRVGQVVQQKLAAIDPDLHRGVSFDGITKLISAGVVVEPRGSYRMRVIIADGSDDKMDSALLLAKKSLRSIPRFRISRRNVSVLAGDFGEIVAGGISRMDREILAAERLDSLQRAVNAEMEILELDTTSTSLEDEMLSLDPSIRTEASTYLPIPGRYRVPPTASALHHEVVIRFPKDTLQLPAREVELLDSVVAHLHLYPGLKVKLYPRQSVTDPKNMESFMPDLRMKRIRYHLIAEGIPADRILQGKGSFMKEVDESAIRPYYVELTLSTD